MTTLALYRKYRPQSFQDVIGQDSIKNILQSMIREHNINHGFIFAGPKGTGKTTIAKIFAKAVNCLNPQNGDACNECENCIAINDNNAIDVVELDAASNNGVDEIRNIVDNVYYLPISLKYKVYIIDEAHMLTTGAWNALLKTLEEPPKHAIFILATTEYNKIPATIVSRCQRYDFHRLTIAQLTDLIKSVSKKEKIKIVNEAAHEIALLSDGAARDALSILSQLAIYASNNIKLKHVNDVFNLTNVSELIEFLNLIHEKKVNQLMKEILNFKNNGVNWNILITNIMNLCMEKYLLGIGIEQNLITYNVDELNKIQLSDTNCLLFANVMLKTLEELKFSIDYSATFLINCLNFLNNGFSHKNIVCDQKNIETKSIPSPKVPTFVSNVSQPTPPLPSEPQPIVKNVDNNSPQAAITSEPEPVLSKDGLFETTSLPQYSNLVQRATNSQNEPSNVIKEEKEITPKTTSTASPEFDPYDLLKNNQQDGSPHCELQNVINQDIFNVIVKNSKKDIVNEFQESLNKYLENHNYDLNDYIGCLNNISQIWVSDGTGIIIAYPNYDNVEQFSKKLNNSQFIEILSKIFGEDKVIFAINNEIRLKMKDGFLAAKENNSIPSYYDYDGYVKTAINGISLKQKIMNLLD